MNPVLERCGELRKRLGQLREVQQNQIKAQSLGQRRIELEKLRLDLARVSASVSVLVTHGHLKASELPEVRKALESCGVVLVRLQRVRLESDPEHLTKGRDYETLLKRIGKINEQLSEQISTRWQALARAQAGGDEKFLGQVETVPGQAEVVAEIRRARKTQEEVSKTVPQSEEEYQTFVRSCDELQRALGRLKVDDFPADVLRFFKRAQSPGGAPLSLLTEEVRSWMEQKGLVDGLRIRFSGGN